MKKIHIPWREIGITMGIAFLFVSPYFLRDFLPIEHDTFFHLSRIEGLARAIQSGDLLPAIYPYKNNGFGYASPLFYCDVLLYPFAILYLVGISISMCYRLAIFFFSWIAIFGMYKFVTYITKKPIYGYLASIAYTFSNYHITDVYVRGALGEIEALAFLPFVLLYAYQLLEERNTTCWKKLAFSIFLLSISHNLSFLLSMTMCFFLLLFYVKEMHRNQWESLGKALLLAFLLGCFYTLPMLEQTRFQQLNLHLYGQHSDLQGHAMHFWQYFINQTVFGYSGIQYGPSEAMVVNVGYFLSFVSLTYLCIPKKNRFITASIILGYLFLFLPIEWIPWDALSFLRILQFPWRLNLIAMTLLSVVSAYSLSHLCKENVFAYGIIALLLAEGLWHIYPVYYRNFGISSNDTYQDILDGKLTDPYYSATYMRVELAGGDYLPVGSVDFRNYQNCMHDQNGNEVDIPITHLQSGYLFQVKENDPTALELPLTYYKGYVISRVDQNAYLPIYKTENGLVGFDAYTPGSYVCYYRDTAIRRFSMWLTTLALTYLYLSHFIPNFNYLDIIKKRGG